MLTPCSAEEIGDPISRPLAWAQVAFMGSPDAGSLPLALVCSPEHRMSVKARAAPVLTGP